MHPLTRIVGWLRAGRSPWRRRRSTQISLTRDKQSNWQIRPIGQASIALAYQRQVVPYHRNEAPGTILVDTDARFVYYVLPEGRAIRYGATVGEDGQA